MRIATTLAVALATALGLAVPAAAEPEAVPPRIPAEDVMAHMRQFQTIATAHGGNRAHGRPGYRASADHVKAKLDAAGFRTTLQPFQHNGSTGWNVIADWPAGDPNDVVFLGAHLDSVTAGPGMNDNASGSAAILETALTLARTKPALRKKLRFGWWGAEELGLVGSRYYVNSLPAAERARIKQYVNFDMVGARNTTTWGVYNDDAAMRRMFEAYFRGQGVPTRPINIAGRSDHASFARIGVPVSGIASGSDPCYHARCDTISNVGANVMATSTNAAAHAAWTLAGASGLDAAIVGGGYVSEAKPWIAALHRNGGFTCTASHIAAQWVLSAAHCVESGGTYSVRIGSLNRSSGGTVATVARIVRHPGYRWPDNDIALLQLTAPVPGTYAPLAEDKDVQVRQPATLYGWGSEKSDWSGPLPQRLKYADGTVSSTRCVSSSAPLVCTQTDGTVAGGDSGGPAFVRSPATGKYVQVGVCAVGRRPATGGWAGYTSVPLNRGWIRQHAGV
ncbi:M28 family peptidase [Actinosynnema sp. CA-248983]